MPPWWLENLSDELREKVFTHPSAGGGEDFERLAFFGDVVIELFVRYWLFRSFPDDPVGELAKKRAVIVSTKALAYLAHEWGLDKHLKFVGEPSPRVLATLTEAFVAAVGLHYGRDKTVEFFYELFVPHIPYLLENFADHKSIVIEKLDKLGLKYEFKRLERVGPPHAPTFTVGLFVEGSLVSVGKGRSVADAEQEAAYNYLDVLNTIN